MDGEYSKQLEFWLNLQASREQIVSFFNSDLNSVFIFLTIEKALSQSALLFGSTNRLLASFARTPNLLFT